MNRIALLFASLCAASTLLLAGCPLGCSGYSGNGDHVFARGSDQLILCANDGFVATIASTTIEGVQDADTTDATTTGVEGDDGQTIFTYTIGLDDTYELGGIGSGWTEVDGSYTSAELDHADVLCTDLTSRSWWSTAP
ncbi:MAG TPA: hypothetical protein VGG74_26770 [Kofleriaceae bacterium]|jgi:hypothetical protein